MALPILDTTIAVGSRILRGISPFEGGRDHLSHRLIRIGVSRELTAIILWSAAGVFGSLAVAIYHWPSTLGYPLMVSGAVAWIGLLIFFARIPSQDA